MKHFEVLTIFPELFVDFSAYGLIRRATQRGQISINATQLRDYAINSQGQIDDTPYGGGSGMLLRPEPAKAAIAKAKDAHPKAPVILLSPRGKPFDQQLAKKLAKDYDQFILLCCRYEGLDQRIVDHHVDLEISIGDFVTMGGEAPALCLIEAISRLEAGVLGNPESVELESFSERYLEHPHYTKPAEFDGESVPSILLSGNHNQIERWRKERSEQDTAKRRPDLLQSKPVRAAVYAALVHHPVVNKEGKTITSSITNLDVHDIARSAQTFGLSGFFVIHPVKILRKLIGRILEHWDIGFGATYNPNRKEALAKVELCSDLDDAIFRIESLCGRLPRLISTSARRLEQNISATELHAELTTTDCPQLILFGTGWGLAPELFSRTEVHLAPICGFSNYNHLSVRSAAAIIFAEVMGKKIS